MQTMRAGFTLIELMVVVIIIGILSSMGVPYYLKTVESSKAMNAVSVAQQVSVASQMLLMDNPSPAVYSGGELTSACNSGSCPTSGTSRDACDLVRCSYIAKQDWTSLAYAIYACNPNTGAGGGGCAAGLTAYAKRRSGKYEAWYYTFDDAGVCNYGPQSGSDQAPSCPSF
jgi:prepilin-type N-terminal cleavage/methylation domain-containing protein